MIYCSRHPNRAHAETQDIMKTKASFVLLLSALFALTIYSPSVFAAGTFSVSCKYSLTKPDDSIVRYGLPGTAMQHDFFGNTGTDAYSDYSTLSANKMTTCDVSGDVSAYWAPQLKRASGIIVPDFAKTYYKNDQPVMPVSPIPPGLQMLAGDHRGTGPNPQINYLCRGGNGYTTIAPTSCPVVTDSNGTYAQLNISIHFPDCWNGKDTTPPRMTGSGHTGPMAFIGYMAYRNKDGTCPADFPVKIPELQMNIQYSLDQDPDLSTAQLSMDPQFVDGAWVPQWGSLYTAHADFISAWKKDTMKYAVDKCSNANTACAGNLPTYYSPATADAWISSTGAVSATDTQLQVGPGDTILMKFPTPVNTTDYPWSGAKLQTKGQNVTDSSAIMLSLYAAKTDWTESGPMPQAADCTQQSIGGIYLDNVDQPRLNDVTNYIRSSIASGGATIGICVRNTTGKTVVLSSREGTFAAALYLK